jgi:hypothetical protein
MKENETGRVARVGEKSVTFILITKSGDGRTHVSRITARIFNVNSYKPDTLV